MKIHASKANASEENRNFFQIVNSNTNYIYFKF